jgi:hypothetical protein
MHRFTEERRPAMSRVADDAFPPIHAGGDATEKPPARHAFQLLQWTFAGLPVMAGLDKLTGTFVPWEGYIASQVALAVPLSAQSLVRVAGLIEVLAGLSVALKPRVGAYVVAGWLALVVVNFVIGGVHLDLALRDFALLVAAVALGRLASVYDRPAIERAPRVL